MSLFSFYAMTGYSANEVMGRNCRFLQRPDTDPVTVRKIREAIGERRAFSGVLLNYRRDGSPFVNELIIDPVFDESGRLLTFVGLQNNVTERERAKELLEEGVRDRTGNYIRLHFLVRIQGQSNFQSDLELQIGVGVTEWVPARE